ncbi:hypothetical protein BDQ17DRAFT_1327522 [Cyathus striatus]|nr:hypothetical protein BDQ17DRAFT_1327522 [Cyathus striatus]
MFGRPQAPALSSLEAPAFFVLLWKVEEKAHPLPTKYSVTANGKIGPYQVFWIDYEVRQEEKGLAHSGCTLWFATFTPIIREQWKALRLARGRSPGWTTTSVESNRETEGIGGMDLEVKSYTYESFERSPTQQDEHELLYGVGLAALNFFECGVILIALRSMMDSRIHMHKENSENKGLGPIQEDIPIRISRWWLLHHFKDSFAPTQTNVQCEAFHKQGCGNQLVRPTTRPSTIATRYAIPKLASISE